MSTRPAAVSYPSSTAATNGSVKSNTPQNEPSSATNNSAASFSFSNSTTAVTNNSNHTAERIAAYLTDHFEANPLYNESSEGSMTTHIASVRSAINYFDATMAAVGGKKSNKD